MDPFEVRMQFVSLLRKLNASQQTIQKIVAYALKNFQRCGEDIWDCIVEECEKGSINTRINILHLLDALCETSLVGPASQHHKPVLDSARRAGYIAYVTRDLDKIMELVVPNEKEGLLNWMNARQILENWRNKRVIEAHVVDDAIAALDIRKEGLHEASSSSSRISGKDVTARIEEDRERHKRLRERRWVQPIEQNRITTLASFLPLPPQSRPPAREMPPPPTAPFSLDIEFENAWETSSDWNEDDDDAAAEENRACFPDEPALRAFAIDPLRPTAEEIVLMPEMRLPRDWVPAPPVMNPEEETHPGLLARVEVYQKILKAQEEERARKAAEEAAAARAAEEAARAAEEALIKQGGWGRPTPNTQRGFRSQNNNSSGSGGGSNNGNWKPALGRPQSSGGDRATHRFNFNSSSSSSSSALPSRPQWEAPPPPVPLANPLREPPRQERQHHQGHHTGHQHQHQNSHASGHRGSHAHGPGNSHAQHPHPHPPHQAPHLGTHTGPHPGPHSGPHQNMHHRDSGPPLHHQGPPPHHNHQGPPPHHNAHQNQHHQPHGSHPPHQAPRQQGLNRQRSVSDMQVDPPGWNAAWREGPSGWV